MSSAFVREAAVGGLLGGTGDVVNGVKHIATNKTNDINLN